MDFPWMYVACMCILIPGYFAKVHPGAIKGGISHRNSSRTASKGDARILNNNSSASETQFDFSSFANMTHVLAQLGSIATLTCQVPKVENITVTWSKVNSSELLTNNSKTKHDDKRYLAVQSEDAREWKLRIRYTQESDNAMYECHVKGMGNLSYSLFTHLRLKKAYARIIGGKSKRVKADSPLRISCVLKNSIEPPDYIFWYKGDSVINYDLTDGATVREGRQGTELIVPRAEPTHSGNYSCVPSNAIQASVVVTVEQRNVVGT